MSSLYRPESLLVRKRLLEARHAAGLTQAAVGEASGLTQEAVSAIERGVRGLDLVELMDLCRVLGVDVAALVAEVRDQAATPRRRKAERPTGKARPRRRA